MFDKSRVRAWLDKKVPIESRDAEDSQMCLLIGFCCESPVFEQLREIKHLLAKAVFG